VLALELATSPGTLDDDDKIRGVDGVDDSVADLAILAVPTHGEDDSEEPVLVTKGVLRVASRFTGNSLLNRRNRLSDGRLAVARMIGDGTAARRAHLSLIELANSLCRAGEPLCEACPLVQKCALGGDLQNTEDSTGIQGLVL
jgi:DNA (cytosine-5)-methyltransferase 1